MVRSPRPCVSIRCLTRFCGSRCCGAMAGDVNRAARCRTWRFTIRNFAAMRAKIPSRILLRSVASVIPGRMGSKKATTASQCTAPSTARLVQAGSSWELEHSSSRRDNILAVPTSDTSPSAQALQLQIQWAMPGEQRLLLALEMSQFARELAKERVRREYPEWSDAQVARELVRLAFLPASVPARLR
jgi:hypothetical protein